MGRRLRVTAPPGPGLAVRVARTETSLASIAGAGHGPPAAGSYVPWTRVGDLVSVSFQLPWDGDRLAHEGVLGRDLSTDEGCAAARICARHVLSQLAEASNGRLDAVALVRVEGHVRCALDFDEIPRVLDAASELFVEVLGERGLHARTAEGHQVTPLGAPVMLGVWAVVDTGASSRPAT